MWRRAYACPCRDPNSGAAKKTCPQCGGRSWLWGSAVRASAAAAGQKAQQQWAQFGLWQSGDVVISLPSDSPMYEMGQFDRVVMLNSSDPFSIPLTRGKDRLSGAILTINRCFWLNQSGAIVEGAVPMFSSDGQLTWEPDISAPPAGSMYTVSGTRLKEYFCWGPFTQDRAMHHGARLPRKVVLRLFDLMGR